MKNILTTDSQEPNPIKKSQVIYAIVFVGGVSLLSLFGCTKEYDFEKEKSRQLIAGYVQKRTQGLIAKNRKHFFLSPKTTNRGADVSRDGQYNAFGFGSSFNHVVSGGRKLANDELPPVEIQNYIKNHYTVAINSNYILMESTDTTNTHLVLVFQSQNAPGGDGPVNVSVKDVSFDEVK